MFPTLQNRAREAFAGAVDRAVEFATLGEYRYLAVESEVAPDAPAEPPEARRAAATPPTPRGRVFAADRGTSGSAPGALPPAPRRFPPRAGRASRPECGGAPPRTSARAGPRGGCGASQA